MHFKNTYPVATELILVHRTAVHISIRSVHSRQMDKINKINTQIKVSQQHRVRGKKGQLPPKI